MASRASGAATGIARSYLNSIELRRACAAIGVVVAALVALTVVLQSLTLSGVQQANRDVGDLPATGELQLAQVWAGQAGPQDTAAAAALDAGAVQAVPGLQTLNLEAAVAPTDTLTVYTERPWSPNTFSQRFSLVSGSWPQSAGEVAVSQALDAANDHARLLQAQTAVTPMTVTGVVAVAYGRSSLQVLAAPGTWASLGSDLAQRYPALTATPTVSWSGGDEAAVVAALEQAQAAWSAATPAAESFDAGAQAQVLVQRRSDVEQQGERGFDERYALIGQLPRWVLPAAAVLLVVASRRRRLQADASVFDAVGVPRHLPAQGLLLALAVLVTVVGTLGALVGVGLGALGRVLVEPLSTNALSPWPDLTGTLATIGVSLAAGILLSVLTLRASTVPPRARTLRRRQGRVVPRSRRLPSLAWVRRATAAVAVAVAADAAFRVQGLAEIGICAAAAVLAATLLAADVVALVVARLPRRSPRLQLAKLRLHADGARVAVATSVLAGVLAVPWSTATLLSTGLASEAAKNTSRVAPGQVVVAPASDSVAAAPPDFVMSALLERVALHSPVDVRYSATPTTTTTVEGQMGTVILVATVDDIARLTGAELGTAQRRTLASGGVVTTTTTDGDDDDVTDAAPTQATATLVTTDASTGSVSATYPGVPADPLGTPLTWSSGVSGVMLLESARHLGIPTVDAPAAYVFTGVSPTDVAAAARVPEEAGFDRRFIGTYHRPADVVAPLSWVAGLAVLAVLVVGVLVSAVRAQVAALRPYAAQLVALGVPYRWARSVLHLQTATICGAAAVTGLAGALVPNVLVVLGVSGFVLSVPWLALGGSAAAVGLAAAAVSLWGSARLRASDGLRGG